MTLHEFQIAMIGFVLFVGAITCAAFLVWICIGLVVEIRDKIFRYRVNKTLWADFLKFRESIGMYQAISKLDKKT